MRKIKVLWLCNIVMPELCEVFGFKNSVYGGWLHYTWNLLLQNSDYEMAICVPIRDEARMKDGIHKQYRYFSFHDSYNRKAQISQFEQILNSFQPDVIHVWGTEYYHSYAMMKACENLNQLNKVVVHIQGLVSVLAKEYLYGIPEQIVIEDDAALLQEKEDFAERGIYEQKLIQNIRYVIGRTDWDYTCTKSMGFGGEYIYCGEILREIFYSSKEKWSRERCEGHTIFISQASYPVKGLHTVLASIARLKEQYEDLKVYVAGLDMMQSNSVYARYLRDELCKYKLQEVIQFVGNLSSEEMYQYYLRANVFLSASLIENSSNSVSEALSVGVPVVSSYVGGMGNLIEHGKNGYLYPLTEPYLLEYYVSQIFDDNCQVQFLSEQARRKFESYNNREEILENIDKIYHRICSKARG